MTQLSSWGWFCYSAVAAIQLTNRMKMAAKLSFLNPSTLKAANITTVNITGRRTFRISNRNVPIQYEEVPTPLTNCICLAYTIHEHNYYYV